MIYYTCKLMKTYEICWFPLTKTKPHEFVCSCVLTGISESSVAAGLCKFEACVFPRQATATSPTLQVHVKCVQCSETTPHLTALSGPSVHHQELWIKTQIAVECSTFHSVTLWRRGFLSQSYSRQLCDRPTLGLSFVIRKTETGTKISNADPFHQHLAESRPYPPGVHISEREWGVASRRNG